jgi:HEAT repeat protein
LLGTTLTAGCAGGTIVDLARQGDLAGVKRSLASLTRDGSLLDRSVVERLSHATVAHDLSTVESEQAVRLVELLAPCAKGFSSELRERAKANDDAAAQATRVLLENGDVSLDTVIGRARRLKSDSWRAAMARALVGPGWGRLRRSLVDDADERVRRGALGAAAIAKDPDDLPGLLEASRLDPDVSSRRLALEAIGALGGARVALTLRDQWSDADSETRLGIVGAWDAPRIYGAGGSRELTWAAETQDSKEAVAAAAALAGHEPDRKRGAKGAKSSPPPDEDRALGRVLLARFVADGSDSEQSYAIELADPTDPLAREALEKAASGEDRSLRVAALARLVRIESMRPKSLESLRALCVQKDDVGRAARDALVEARDLSVVPLLLADLSDEKEETRARAAEDLVELGQLSVAASSLTDESLDVRARTACAVAASEE